MKETNLSQTFRLADLISSIYLWKYKRKTREITGNIVQDS